MLEANNKVCINYLTSGKIKHFSREGQIFPGGSYFDIFLGKCKISKLTMC